MSAVSSPSTVATSVDLYRSGNASSPRMDNVRLGLDPDIEHYNRPQWRRVGQGGYGRCFNLGGSRSSMARQALEGASQLPDSLRVKIVERWPELLVMGALKDMRLSDYRQALEAANTLFSRV